MQQSSVFESSDSVRGAERLRFARVFELAEPLGLELGGVLPAVSVTYETYGVLNAAGDNAVLVCHALSGDSHVAKHEEGDTAGWWELAVAPGGPIDTDRYFVICPNVLGGCRGTTGPNSVNPETQRPYGAEFPTITVGDMVEVQRRLVDHLGVGRLRAVVGGSLGGHLVLTWARRFPERLAGAAALATSPRLTAQALAFDVVGRNAITSDAAYHGGQYYDQPSRPAVGLAIARMLGHITYLSREAMTRKFDLDRLRPRDVETAFETRFSVGSYLAHQGGRFVERFDANSYVTLSLAMDMFDLGESPAAVAASLAPAQCRWLLVSFSSDWLFPPFQSRQIADALIAAGKPVSYCDIKSECGHDGFLLPNEFDQWGEMLRAFLCNLDGGGAGAGGACGFVVADDALACGPTSIYGHRLDYDTMLDLIPAGASVLDLGCGNGGLLARLRARGGHEKTMGVELSAGRILACLRRGLDVVQGDLNEGLAAFGDDQFDVVVLSQTLQTVTQVERVLTDMLRVGRRCVVSFPNFAYRELREQLAREGRAPRAGGVLRHEWFDTPNVRFLSITDFEEFCAARGITIHQCVALDTAADRAVSEDPNLNADVAIMVVSR